MAFAEYDLVNVTFTKGKPKSYESSQNVIRTFCDTCGSPIEWKHDDSPNSTSFALGLFDEKTGFAEIEDLYKEESSDWYH